ncbi:4-hydroxy-tetrahydrodipicolinate reductase [soil metagenome]
MKTRVAVLGARGRVGSAIVAAAEKSGDVEVFGVNRGDELRSESFDVLIDVSHPDATAAALQTRKPLVIGTTGHSDQQRREIEQAAQVVPIVLAPNFSVGVNTLFWLTRKAAELLGEGFDLEIVETHHRLKKDAPSGTAKRLAEVLCEVRGWSYESEMAHGRAGLIGERPARQIGMHAVRAGDVVGEHTVIFAGTGERVELTHRASSRDTFACGALRAARWVIGKAPGLYSMEDVLGL